jgi:hypothetical protein
MARRAAILADKSASASASRSRSAAGEGRRDEAARDAGAEADADADADADAELDEPPPALAPPARIFEDVAMPAAVFVEGEMSGSFSPAAADTAQQQAIRASKVRMGIQK